MQRTSSRSFGRAAERAEPVVTHRWGPEFWRWLILAFVVVMGALLAVVVAVAIVVLSVGIGAITGWLIYEALSLIMEAL